MNGYYRVVSLSGGKDSTAMLFMMLERGMRVDDVVFFDTGWEFPQMYEHIARVEEVSGVRITRLHPTMPLEHYMYDHVIKKGKRKGERGYGWPRKNSRWCTRIKTDVIDKHVRAAAAEKNIVQFVGIAADEAHRCNDKSYPLVDWGITEADALAYCQFHGFDFSGLYDHRKRVSCWCCPLQSLDCLRATRRWHPDLWKRLADMDARSRNSFMIRKRRGRYFDVGVDDLERRFSAEDRQLALPGLETELALFQSQRD